MASETLHAHEYDGKDTAKKFADNPDDEYSVNAIDEAIRANLSWRQSRDGEERLHLHSIPVTHGTGRYEHGPGVTVIDAGDAERDEEERY